MSNKNLINASIPAQVITDATTKLNDAYTLLKPYLVEALSKEEINGMPKLGEKSEPYVDKGLQYATNYPNTVPRRCNIADATKDFALFEVLRNLDIISNQLSIRINHTRLLAGSEAIDCINDYYKSIKQDAQDGVAEAIPIYNELKQRYQNVGKYIRTPKEPNA